MNRSRTTDGHQKTLRRVVAMLFALADLAERASGRSLAVRWSVLWLLLPGEAIARDYLAGLTGDPRLASRPAPEANPVAGCSPADAIRLAQSFRTIAAALVAFVEDIGETWQPAMAASASSLLATMIASAARSTLPAKIERCDSS